MVGTAGVLVMRYEGGGVWEGVYTPYLCPVSPGFSALVRAHHLKQLRPEEERALAFVGLERGVFFHVVDVERALGLN